MGGIVKGLFGGSDSKSSSTNTSTSNSGNNAFDYLKGALSGNLATGNSAFAQMASLLGVGGDPAAAQAGMKNYMDSSGAQFMLDQGSKAITGNAAAKGMLNSGATAKALTQFGQNLGSQQFNNYLGQLQGLMTGGLQSAQTISGAGNFSNSTSKGTSTSRSNSMGGIIPGLFG